MALSIQKSAMRSDINVTPLVDVVLVLLIIFMVVTPLLEKELAVRIPDLDTQDLPPPDIPPDEIVVQIKNGGRLYINKDEIQKDQLLERLTNLNNSRSEKIVFFDADDVTNYGEAVGVLDIIKASGTDIIGMMLPDALGGAENASPGTTPAPAQTK